MKAKHSRLAGTARTHWHVAAALGALALTAPALAAENETAASEAVAPEPPPRGKTVFLPADFAQFAPRTALDMVAQIPGFVIESGNNGGDRGLGSARQNVLINGERVVGKSNDAVTTLSQTAAASVVRIEIVDGATLREAGLTGQVANVIINSDAFSTTLKWQPQFRPRLDPNLMTGSVSTSGKLGGNTVTLSLSNNGFRNGHWGPEQRFDGNGVLQYVRDEFATYYGDRPRLSGSLSRTAANGNKLNLNLAGELFFFDQETLSTSTQPGRGAVIEDFDFYENEWNAEGGGDYEFGLGGGRMKLIGVQRLEHSPTQSLFIVTDPGGVSGSRFRQTADEGESILRGEYRWKSGAADWQIALEGAYNFLNVDAEFAVRQPDGRYNPVTFGGESTRVREKRSELTVTYGRPLTSNLSLQANLAAEYSAITLAGPGGTTRQYVRPKGKAALVWKVSPTLTLNAEVQRRVDQLSFFDFASSVDLQNNNGNSGNGQLVPPQVWRGAIEAVVNLGRYGNVSLTAAHARLEDVVDQIPLSPTTEGRGNLPLAKAYRFQTKGTIQLDPFGIKGAKVDFDVTLRRNRVRDPLLGNWRDLSFSQDHAVEINFRHDIPASKWAWGAGLFEEGSALGYRLDEIAGEDMAPSFASLFVEHKDVAGFTVRASYQNLLGSSDRASRIVYVDRRDGPIAFRESSNRRFGQFLAITVSGTL